MTSLVLLSLLYTGHASILDIFVLSASRTRTFRNCRGGSTNSRIKWSLFLAIRYISADVGACLGFSPWHISVCFQPTLNRDVANQSAGPQSPQVNKTRLRVTLREKVPLTDLSMACMILQTFLPPKGFVFLASRAGLDLFSSESLT